jgi:putative ABC transport system substrate-binding protein
MIARRSFIALVGGAAASWPVVARAQQSDRMRRVGILMPFPKGDSEYENRVSVLRQELAKLGWTGGGNVQFDERWTGDNMDQVRSNAASLLASNPDVVVAAGGRVIPVLLQISRSVPIVVPGAADPVGAGWVKSLARPGGNITGFTFLELSMFGKMLEILKEIAPATVRVALTYNPDNPNSVLYRRTISSFAVPLALEPIDLPIHGLVDFERAVKSLAERPSTSVFFVPDVTVYALRAEIIALVEKHRLPAIYSDPFFVKDGGLASYGPDRTELFRSAAGYIDRILRGENAGELPFQQPTKYQFMINLKTAKALGLTVSPTLVARADEVIE